MTPTDITKYLSIVHRRQWWIIVPSLLTLLVGLAYAMTAPKVFEARTLIMIVAQKVPEDYVRAIVSLSMEERLTTIQQQVTSRTNLEAIIEKHQLFNDPSDNSTFLEEQVADIKKRIEISVTRGTAFTISYRDENPYHAVSVTNALASKFISENLKIREGQALGTSRFLTDELKTVKSKLEEKEEVLQEYQRKYMGAMPEHIQTNLSMLTRYQDSLQQLTTNISDAESRKLILHQQAANLETMRNQMMEIGTENSMLEVDTSTISLESDNLTALREELSSLRSRYSEKHPDVIRLQKMIEKVEATESSKPEEPELEPETDLTASGPSFDMNGDFLTPQLEQIDLEIRNIKEEIEKVKAQSDLYQRRVEETPKREQELLVLKRDYENLVRLYDSLLERKLEADIAVSMEKKQKGEQFRVLDSAKLPERPIAPNIKQIIFLSLVFGIALGGGCAFLVENLNPAYQNPGEIERELQLPVLASIPFRHTEIELKKIKRKTILSYTATGLVFLLSATGIVIATKGMDKTMEFIRDFVAGA